VQYLALGLCFFQIIFFYIKGKLFESVFVLLLFSSFVKEGVNIYNTHIGEISLFYISIFIMAVIAIYKNNFFLDRIIANIVLYFLFLLTIGLLNVDYLSFLIKDSILFAIPIAIFVVYRGLSNETIFKLFISLIGVKVITTLIMFSFGITLEYDDNMFLRPFVDNIDEMAMAFKVLILSLLLFTTKFKYKSYLLMLLVVSIFGSFAFGTQFIGLGSLSLMTLMTVLLFYALKSKYPILLLLMPIGLLFLLLVNLDTGNAFTYKINNILELGSYLFSQGDIYTLPNSPQVRIIEILNISQDPVRLFFGYGFGGWFTDSYVAFGNWINEFDFTRYEIENRVFFNPHNIGYVLLKYGILFYIFLYILLSKYKLFRKDYLRVLYINIIFVASLTIGYGIKTSILLSFALIMLHNIKKDRARG
jgi:hypothetical protein